MNITLSSAYNPPVQYFSKFLLGYPIIIEQYDTYVKQSYRNRCVINSADGPMSLSIPVVFSASKRTKTKDVLISDHANWQHTHWNAIISAYNSSPFFEYYRDDFERFYAQEFKYLIDYNGQLLQLILSLLKIDPPKISHSEKYIDSKDQLDFRELIHPKRNHGRDNNFHAVPYYQLFRDKRDFQPNLSILDLLFNMGNESQLVLADSIVK